MAKKEVSASSNTTTNNYFSVQHGLHCDMYRSTWQVLLGIVALGSTVLYLLLSPISVPFQLSERLVPNGNEFFHWATTSSYREVDQDDAADAMVQELCKSFPHEKLLDIQPILKSGHGAMNRVRSQLNGPAACLTNLLIFSDLDEVLGRYNVTDTIKDIPRRLIESDNQTLPYRHLKDLAANGTLNETEMSQLQGWETDKFKFLPDVSRAWQMSPEKQWYAFFEGDTYIVWDNVFRLLEQFDPNTPHYFGSPSPGRDGIWFANGGPGFILSRATMRKLVEDDYDKKGDYLGSRFSVKHWNETLVNCCGDSILGWALWEESIKLEGLWPMFNPHPPHGVPFADGHWCQPILSMHKPNEDDMTKLWRWEWQHRNVTRRPLLYRDLAVSYYNSFMGRNGQDWDNSEWDAFYPQDSHDQPDLRAAHTSPSKCRQACAKYDGCFQWTYHLGRCHFVRSFGHGRARAPQLDEGQDGKQWLFKDQRYFAGWSHLKIGKWIEERPCEQVQWVKPSVERIF